MKIEEISKKLAEKVSAVCRHLLPGGKENGPLWVAGDISGDPGKSLQVQMTGPHVGKWKDWADQTMRGDLLDLWGQVKGVTPIEAVRQAKDWLGIAEPMKLAKKVYKSAPEYPSIKNVTPDGKVMNYLCQERRLSPEIVDRFKIGAVNGKHGETIVYPCYSLNGQIQNRCYTALKRDEKGKKIISQDAGCAPMMFGWQAWRKEDFEARMVVITEGQIDAMSWFSWGVPAISIPNGGGMTWIDYNYEDLQFFDIIFLSFDMDGKTKPEEAANRLGIEKCRIVKLPEKDANDCLKAGCTPEQATQWLSEAKYVELPTLIRASDMRDEFVQYAMNRNLETGFTHEIFWAHDKKKFHFRPEEVTIWSGISSHGKSTFLRWMFVQILASPNDRVGLASFEVPAKRSLLGMSNVYRGASENMTHGDFIDKLGGKICLYNKLGYGEPNELLEAIRYSSKRFGVTHFLIDSLMRINGLEEDYVEQGKFMNKLQEVAKTTGVHIHIVMHEKKGSDGEFNADNIKGSSLLRNNTDNILSVRRNTEKKAMIMAGELKEDDMTMPDGWVIIDKDREADCFAKIPYYFFQKYESFRRMA